MAVAVEVERLYAVERQRYRWNGMEYGKQVGELVGTRPRLEVITRGGGGYTKFVRVVSSPFSGAFTA